ncbi:MAG: MFS transporter, partial [Bacteroidales bacterium]|nr:MFS transporter [Bacteroidales bacterium]
MTTKENKNTAYVITISIVAALGGLLFGYDTAVISGAIGFLRTHFDLSAIQMGWAASCALAGCVIGVTLAGFLSDKFGRKKILLLAAVLFAISAIGSSVPETITQLIIFRIIGGFGVGMASMLSPLYIAEIAPARMRGRLVSINQFAIVSGILLVYFVNYFITDNTNESWNINFGWRWMFASETLPALLFFILLFFVPESPRWLVQKN